MNLDRSRILVVKPSSLGDVVHTLPVVHAIKRHHPSCHIGWIVQKSFAAVLEADPAVDEIIPISIPSTSDPLAARGTMLRALAATLATLRQLRKRFRDKPFDLVLDLHASFRSGLLGSVNPGGVRIGFSDAKELNTLFQDHTIAPDPEKPHAVDKNLLFAHHLECPLSESDFRVIVGAEAKERVHSFLSAEGSDANGMLVYANPAAKWTTKQWTVERWAALGDLLATGAGATVIFGGGPDDLPHILAITERMSSKALVSAGKLQLSDSVALLEMSRLYVGVDSGPMHIAAFLGIPIVALFGPTDPVKVGPYGAGHSILRANGLDCLACRKRSCSDRRCMEQISAQRVYDECMKLILG